MTHTNKFSASLRQNDSISLFQDIQKFFLFKKEMGISGYPRSTEVQNFLTNHSNFSPVEAQPNPPKTIPAKINSGADKIPSNVQQQLQVLQKEIHACNRCDLTNNRQGIVFGTGSTNASLMIIGDWSFQPAAFTSELLFGRQEDEMLWKMMHAIGLSRQSVYVTNCIKCCPDKLHQPGEKSEQSCFFYLEKEIAAIKPKIICAMGEIASRLLISTTEPFIRLRGRFHSLKSPALSSVKVMPTYHPKFLIEHQEMKKATWLDLQTIQKKLSKTN